MHISLLLKRTYMSNRISLVAFLRQEICPQNMTRSCATKILFSPEGGKERKREQLKHFPKGNS